MTMATLDSFKPPYREIADYIARCRRLAYVSNEKQVWTVDERPHEDAADRRLHTKPQRFGVRPHSRFIWLRR